MSAIAENLRRQRLPLLTIAACVVGGAVAWALISNATSEHLTTSERTVAAPAVEQAEWRVEYTAQGRFGKLTKAQRERYATQKKNVATLVQSFYDGIFLEPAQLDKVLKGSFSAAAANSIHPDKLGFPEGATEVKTIKRSAHVALDAQTSDYAIGRIAVVAEAGVGGRTVDIEHESTLWLERVDTGWKVIAFDLEQGPAK